MQLWWRKKNLFFMLLGLSYIHAGADPHQGLTPNGLNTHLTVITPSKAVSLTACPPERVISSIKEEGKEGEVGAEQETEKHDKMAMGCGFSP